MKFLFYLLTLLSFTNTLPSQESSERANEYLYLNEIALEAGADKSSAFHNYTEVYSQYLNKLKDKPIRFLEIGIWKGYSVKMWEKYFSTAELHFIDITPNAIEYFSERSQYHFLDQADAKALKVFADSVGGAFDVIIDDGGHTMQQQITSFQSLFPYLKSGGLYIIEDLHTSYWKTFGGKGTPNNPKSGKGTTVHFLKELIEDLNYKGAVSTRASGEGFPSALTSTLNLYRSEIYSMHFYTSVCIIIKK